MTDKALNYRINKLLTAEMEIDILTKTAESLRTSIGAELEERGKNEHNTGRYVIRCEEITTRKLDGKALKAVLPDLATYVTESKTRRLIFTAV